MTDKIDIFHLDPKALREQASKDLDEGAVTNNYGLDVDKACELLNAALATEILCVLRYRHHQIIAKSIDKPQVAAEFQEHAEEEEKHMLMIAERINQLGGNPDFSPHNINTKAVTEYGGDQPTLRKMIEDDLIAERVVIDVYKKYIDWFGSQDPTTRRMLEKILEDEEDHADDLADLLTQN